MKVAVIGCGYVGCSLGKVLLQRSHDVVGCCRSDAGLNAIAGAGLRAMRLDARDVDAVGSLLVDCDAVYFLVGAGRGGDYRDTYVASAETLAAACKRTNVSRVVYTSSTSVYSEDEGGWVDEEAALETSSPQQAALVEAERTLLGGCASHDSPRVTAVSVIRLAGIYGPRREIETYALRSAGGNRDDGNVFVNLVHLADICEALSRLLTVEHHGVLNLSGDEPILRRELYDAILADGGAEPIRWTDADQPARGKRVRNTRIKQTLAIELCHPSAHRIRER